MKRSTRTLFVLIFILALVVFVSCDDKKIKVYRVTFALDNGTEFVIIKDVNEGECVEKPKDPTAEYMAFTFWSADGKTEFNFEEKITSNLTLHAVWKEKYTIGGKGPAGGYIFYDCDADNDSGNADGLISSECGWRFLEAAPENVGKYVFGYYRTSDTGSNTEVGTSAEIGYGKANTERLVTAMGATTYKADTGSDKELYAAVVCFGYEKNGYKDWFLPSPDELKQMYENLIKAGVVTFESGHYLSSFENPTGGTVAQMLVYSNGKIMTISRGTSAYVLPVRSF